MEDETRVMIALLTSTDEKAKLQALSALLRESVGEMSSVQIFLPLILQRILVGPPALKPGVVHGRKLGYMLLRGTRVGGAEWVSLATCIDRDLQAANGAASKNILICELGVIALRTLLSLPYSLLEEYTKSRWETLSVTATLAQSEVLRLTVLDVIFAFLQSPVAAERQERDAVLKRLVSARPKFAEVLRRLLQDRDDSICAKSFELLALLQHALPAEFPSTPLVSVMPLWTANLMGVSVEFTGELLSRVARLPLPYHFPAVVPALTCCCLHVVKSSPSSMGLLLSLVDDVVLPGLRCAWTIETVLASGSVLLSIVAHHRSLLLSFQPHLSYCVERIAETVTAFQQQGLPESFESVTRSLLATASASGKGRIALTLLGLLDAIDLPLNRAAPSGVLIQEAIARILAIVVADDVRSGVETEKNRLVRQQNASSTTASPISPSLPRVAPCQWLLRGWDASTLRTVGKGREILLSAVMAALITEVNEIGSVYIGANSRSSECRSLSDVLLINAIADFVATLVRKLAARSEHREAAGSFAILLLTDAYCTLLRVAGRLMASPPPPKAGGPIDAAQEGFFTSILLLASSTLVALGEEWLTVLTGITSGDHRQEFDIVGDISFCATRILSTLSTHLYHFPASMADFPAAAMSGVAAVLRATVPFEPPQLAVTHAVGLAVHISAATAIERIAVLSLRRWYAIAVRLHESGSESQPEEDPVTAFVLGEVLRQWEALSATTSSSLETPTIRSVVAANATSEVEQLEAAAFDGRVDALWASDEGPFGSCGQNNPSVDGIPVCSPQPALRNSGCWTASAPGAGRRVQSCVVSALGDPLQVLLSISVAYVGAFGIPEVAVAAVLTNQSGAVLSHVSLEFLSTVLSSPRGHTGHIGLVASHHPHRTVHAYTSNSFDLGGPLGAANVTYRGHGAFAVEHFAPQASALAPLTYYACVKNAGSHASCVADGVDALSVGIRVSIVDMDSEADGMTLREDRRSDDLFACIDQGARSADGSAGSDEDNSEGVEWWDNSIGRSRYFSPSLQRLPLTLRQLFVRSGNSPLYVMNELLRVGLPPAKISLDRMTSSPSTEFGSVLSEFSIGTHAFSLFAATTLPLFVVSRSDPPPTIVVHWEPIADKPTHEVQAVNVTIRASCLLLLAALTRREDFLTFVRELVSTFN